jgi:hypothetical protein
MLSCSLQIDNMRLVYDNVTRTSSNSEGVEIRIPGFGNTTSVEWLDPSEASPGAYFKDIANMLVALGYERNVSLRGAPYDFRKAPSKSLVVMLEKCFPEGRSSESFVSRFFLQNFCQVNMSILLSAIM